MQFAAAHGVGHGIHAETRLNQGLSTPSCSFECGDDGSLGRPAAVQCKLSQRRKLAKCWFIVALVVGHALLVRMVGVAVVGPFVARQALADSMVSIGACVLANKRILVTAEITMKDVPSRGFSVGAMRLAILDADLAVGSVAMTTMASEKQGENHFSSGVLVVNISDAVRWKQVSTALNMEQPVMWRLKGNAPVTLAVMGTPVTYDGVPFDKVVVLRKITTSRNLDERSGGLTSEVVANCRATVGSQTIRPGQSLVYSAGKTMLSWLYIPLPRSSNALQRQAAIPSHRQPSPTMTAEEPLQLQKSSSRAVEEIVVQPQQSSAGGIEEEKTRKQVEDADAKLQIGTASFLALPILGHMVLFIRRAVAASRRTLSRKGADGHEIFPCGDELDRQIGTLAVPAIANYLIIPITQTVDLFFIGKLGIALAVAGQAAANQVFSTAGWIGSVIPTVTTMRVAKAKAAEDDAEVQTAIGEGFFIAGLINTVVAIGLLFRQRAALTLAGSVEGLPFSLPYLQFRLPGLIFVSLWSLGHASFRGIKDTVTPFWISVAANLVNCVLNPILMFDKLATLPGGIVVPGFGLGIAGAALATTVCQLVAATTYLKLLLAKKLVRWRNLLRPPSRESMARLAGAGGAMQVRAFALNIAFFALTKSVQDMDKTGMAAAAHAITLQLWQFGGVILLAFSAVAIIVIPAEMEKKGARAARAAANRLLAWSAILGGALGIAQIAALPLLGVLTPIPEVQRAARLPSVMGAGLQLINGWTFCGEQIMLAVGSFRGLALAQVLATTSVLLLLRLNAFAGSLPGIWATFYAFMFIRFGYVVRNYFFTGPLVLREAEAKSSDIDDANRSAGAQKG